MKVMVKHSPIVLIWKFAVIEAAGFLLYLAAVTLGNEKYELYTQLSFSSLLSYQIAKILFLAAAQFAVTIYAFLSWFYEFYIIDPGLITYAHGVFSKKRKFLRIDHTTTFSISSNPLGKLFHYGSIRATTGGASLDLNYISRPEKIVALIRHEDIFEKEPDIRRLLAENEHEGLEFKSSLRFDYKMGQANRDVEKAAMKTVAAFLNSKGGHLILGVNDARVPLGIRPTAKRSKEKMSTASKIILPRRSTA